MPDQDQLGTLISKLTALSRVEKIVWNETADEDAFQSSLTKFVVTVSRTHNSRNWDVWDYHIKVHDLTGKLIEEASDSDFPEGFLIDDKPASSALNGLHDLARRKAQGVDKALSDLIGSLDQLGH